MELEELKTMWQQYDSKLNNLEKMNKKLLMETFSKKPRRRLNYMKFQNIYGIIGSPILIIVVFYPYFKVENIDLKFIIGGLLTLFVVIFCICINFKKFRAVKRINIEDDTVLNSAKKVTDLHRIFNSTQMYTWISVPIMFAGVLLMIWKWVTFDARNILFMAGLLIFIIVYGAKQFKIQQNRIEKLRKEIHDLYEYVK